MTSQEPILGEYSLGYGLGSARNAVIACAAAGFIAVGERWGTLSEIALANARASR